MGPVYTERGLPAFLSWPIRVALAAGIAILLSYLPYRLVGAREDSKLEAMSGELRRVEREIAALKSGVEERRRHVEALKTDTRTVEDIARQELQMLYPHEKVLRLERESR